MTDPLEVSPHEFGTLRLFTTALDPDDASNITAQNVNRLLGANVDLISEKIEVIPTRSVAGLGLTGYLRDGYGIPEDQLQGRAAQLDAVSGLLVFLPASAFGGKAASLDPHPSMRFLGLFHEEKAAAPGPMAPTDSAKGTVEPARPKKSTTAASGGKRSWLIALGALLIAAVLVLAAFR
ncbi:hypothetical protein GQ651_15785 [Alphaproteobacteria bacterium GH1-50]|uniref:Aspartate carbamoyltransferase catalytic subunit n=1 Tax=Kangsaoukella pontilimi TaxID=2691042 RepID=A0A7C9IT45_9RHOB|nr:hypothetical protein [Kangsaoukella pontilimi]MXQ09306.1 hypothetical protein [Kangsaoukella pontilimi]